MKRKFHIIAGVILASAVAGCSSVAVNPPVIEARPVTMTDGGVVDPVKIKAEMADLNLRPIGFARMQTTIPRGAIIGEARFRTLACWYDTKIHYDDDRKLLSTTAYNDIFYRVLSGYGYRVAGNPDILFETVQEQPDLLVGANVSAISGELCRHVDTWSGRPDGNLSGTVRATVNWQVFDPARRRVVWQKDFEGTFVAPGPLPGDYDLFVQHAFADSANRLAADPSFRDLLKRRPVQEAAADGGSSRLDAGSGRRPLLRQPLLTGSIDAHIDYLRSATVLIESGDSGHGSGFLVSEDGLVVTNQHVVGRQHFVRVRLVSGRTVIGEVLRSDERRDVALVLLEGSGYPALPVRETPVRVTEEVYAIGAPQAKFLAWTVTRGAVSAYRQAVPPDLVDYIQADVAIHGGNSGGPLLDHQGNLVGISVAGYAMDLRKRNASLNLFVPIMDGLNKLGLDLLDPPAYERARQTAAAN